MLDVVGAVFAQLGAIPVDHQPTLPIAAAVHATLHALADRHVLGLGVFGAEAEQFAPLNNRVRDVIYCPKCGRFRDSTETLRGMNLKSGQP